ncbi:MAG: permease-like cell division protein FtsX [Alistipes senegalensis]|nr:permease-like cell division protein FtsX [Bacteroides cellulosilyticus]MCM1351532.1 permease-like cell division protein FtsX [Alistipes senegalensis]
MKDDKRLKRKVRNSYLISTVSMALVLFLLGSVGHLMFVATIASDSLKESIAVTVELRNGITPETRDRIEQRLSGHELVRTVTFVSKEEKLEDAEFRKLFGAHFEEVLGENPLLDSYELTLTSHSDNQEAVQAFLAEAERIDGVKQVSFPAQLAEQLHGTVNKIRLILLLFSGALAVISLILLNNTIRLAIYSKRYLINTMKMVGATKGFILRPFLASSITQGFLAGTGASVLFVAAMYGLNETVPGILTAAEYEKTLLILGAMIAAGIVLSLVFTWTALNRFINMASNKIYLY